MKEYARYAVGVLFIIGVVVLMVVGFNMLRNLITGDDKPASQQQQANSSPNNLLNAGSNNTPVRYTISGSVVGQEDFRRIRFTINANNRKVEVLQGYGENILKSAEYPNSSEAYTAFIAAINGAGFSSSVSADGRGTESQSCPTARRFSYQINPDAQNGFRTWSASCNRKLGTFTGNANLVQTLFQRQIPDYREFTQDVRLNPS